MLDGFDMLLGFGNCDDLHGQFDGSFYFLLRAFVVEADEDLAEGSLAQHILRVIHVHVLELLLFY